MYGVLRKLSSGMLEFYIAKNILKMNLVSIKIH